MAYAQDYRGGSAVPPVGVWIPAYDENGRPFWHNNVTFVRTYNLRADTPNFRYHSGIPVLPSGPGPTNFAASANVYREPDGHMSPNGYIPSNGYMSPNGHAPPSGYIPPVGGYIPPASGYNTPVVAPDGYVTPPPNGYGRSGPLPHNGHMMTSPPPSALNSPWSPPPQPQGEIFSASPHGWVVETRSQAPVMPSETRSRRYSPSFGSTYAKGGFVYCGYRWEECYELDGKKFWRHKETGVVVRKDPYV